MGDERKYLTKEEINALIEACNNTDAPHRNRLLILLSYRHGLRCKEASNLLWSDIDFTIPAFYIRRAKGSVSGVHRLATDEVRLLKKVRNLCKSKTYVFQTSTGLQWSTEAIRKWLQRLSKQLGNNDYHHHALRHSCGQHLAEAGKSLLDIQNYLGHKDVGNTIKYVQWKTTDLGNWWE